MLITELAERLQNYSGKKVYGYLPPATKRIADAIVDNLASNERVAEAYSLWQDMRDEVFSFYSKSKPERVPLSQQKEFKPVRNMVIREVVQMMEQLQDEGVEYNKPHQTVPNKEKMMPALLANAILLFTAAESIENLSAAAVLPAITASNPFPSYPLISASGSRFGSARFWQK